MRLLYALLAATVLIGTATGCEIDDKTPAERPVLVTDTRHNVIRVSEGVRWDVLLILDDRPDAPLLVVDQPSAQIACDLYAGTFEMRTTATGDEWWCNDVGYVPTP